jgi:hypothetical protein
VVNLLTIKRGDTFSYLATWEGAVLSELKSQIKDSKENLISAVKIEDTATAGTFRLSVADTKNWPIGTLVTDIQRTSADIKSSDTMSIVVIRDVTE